MKLRTPSRWFWPETEYGDRPESLIPLSGYCASYSVSGSGLPMVLLPGLAGGISLLQPLVRHLGRSFRVHCLDWRGERDPFDIRRPFGVKELTGDVLEFCDALRLESPLLMGVSFGAAVALETAIRQPGRFCGLVVQGAEVRFEPTLVRRVAGEILNGYPLPTDNPFVNQFFHLLFGGRPKDQALVRFVVETCWQTDQAVMSRRFNIAARLDLSPRLARIRTPTLIIRGGRDLFVTAEGTAELVRRIPRAELVEIPSAGHLAFLTHAREVAASALGLARDLGLGEGASVSQDI